jgi:hypothetical protein
VPRPVTPRPFVFGEVFAVAGVELPRPNDTGEAGEEALALGAFVAAEFAEFRVPVTPELLLIELHGANAVLSAPMPEVVKPVVGLRPPLVGLSPLPSKVDRATAPGPPLAQGPGLTASVNGAGVVWELSPMGWPKSAPSDDVAPMPPGLGMRIRELPEVWPKSAPSGDVAPMLPGLDVSVCAALWQRPSAVMETITAAVTNDFIGGPVMRSTTCLQRYRAARPGCADIQQLSPADPIAEYSSTSQTSQIVSSAFEIGCVKTHWRVIAIA